MNPFKYKCAETSDGIVALGDLARLWVEDDVAFRDAAFGVKGDTQTVCQRLCLLEQNLNLIIVVYDIAERPSEEVIA